MKIVKLQNTLLALLFFSINFEVWDPLNTGGIFSLAKFFGIIYLVSILPSINKFIVIPKKIRSILIPIFLFYFLLFLMNIININYLANDVFSSSILLNIIFFVFIINHERLVPGVIEKSFIGFLIGALLSTAAFYFGIGLEIESDGRVKLFGDNQNLIGIRMVVASFLLTHYILKYRYTLSKILIALLFLAYMPILTLLFNTGSRVSVISLLLGTALFFILYRTKKIATKAVSMIVLLSFSGIVIDSVLKSDVVGARLTKTIEEGNLAGRDEIWSDILPLIQNNFLLGVGQTGYIDFFRRIRDAVPSPHNVIIEVMSYTGIIGTVLYLLFVYRVFFSSLRYYFKYNELIPLLFAVPVAGILFSGQILTFKLGWFIFAYAATRNYYTK